MQNSDFVSIRMSTLRGDQPIDFDAYVKINDKYVLYLRSGDSFEGERLTRLKSKKLKKMFIQPEQEELYRKYLTRNIEMAYDNNSGKSMENRVAIVQGNQQAISDGVMEFPENEITYIEAKNATIKFVNFLDDELAVKHLLNLENTENSVSHHAVSVSTLSIALAKKLGMKDAKQLQLLSLGALVHDLEHFSSGVNPTRPIKSFSPEELKLYLQHPSAGSEKARAQKHFDASVINIIAQHEELVDGSGYPMGMRESQMDPLAVIVGSANIADRMMSFEGVPKKDVAKKLMVERVGNFPLSHIQNLADIINTI